MSVDKTPLALWLQAASARVFGFSQAALLVPEALIGVASVGVLYVLVARYWGRPAGLAAALCLAVTPVSVAVSRDNNPDALFVLLLLLAVLAGARAAESGRIRTLVLSAALVGLAFNTKMLLAAVVLPGLLIAWLLAGPAASWRRRLSGVAAAGGALVVTSGVWVAAVALTPAADRPWVGSTGDDSIISLALGYNGVGRVAGQAGGTSVGTGGFGLGGAFSGAPGPFRLLGDAFGDQVGWLLPLALAGGLSLLLAVRRVPERRRAAWLWAVGGWFVLAFVLLSAADGIVHTYYASLIAPPLCALAGAGLVSLVADARRGGTWPLLPIGALGVTAVVQLVILGRSDYLPWLGPALGLLALAGALAIALAAWAPPSRKLPRGVLAGSGLAVGLLALLLAPGAWALSASRGAVSGVFPGAGPRFVSGLSGGPAGGRGGALLGGGGTEAATALAWAERHGPGTRYALIVASEEEAAPLVVEGRPIAAMGGFTGRETVMAPSRLAGLVRSGRARYFLLGGAVSRIPNPSVELVQSVCAAVPAAAWGGSTGTRGRFGGGGATLYDCAGRAGALAAG